MHFVSLCSQFSQGKLQAEQILLSDVVSFLNVPDGHSSSHVFDGVNKKHSVLHVMHSVSLAMLSNYLYKCRFKESDSFLYSPSSQVLTH